MLLSATVRREQDCVANTLSRRLVTPLKLLNHLILSVVLLMGLSACGGGDTAPIISEDVPISDRGFADNGIFFGSLAGTEVLLVLHENEYFLLAGEFASQGSYNVVSVALTGSGRGFDLGQSEQPIGNIELRGDYRTDRNLDLIWLETDTGVERNVRMEATTLYFREAPLEAVLGSWVNQDEANLTFFSISNNQGPVAGDDFYAVAPGTAISLPVLANDRDVENDTITITEFDAVTRLGGVVTNDDMGTPDDATDDQLTYLPPAGVLATDTFNYTIEDSGTSSDTAVVTIRLGEREADLELSLDTSNQTPLTGDTLTLTVQLANTSARNTVDSVRVQVLLILPDGLVFVSSNDEANFESATGFWQPTLSGGAISTLTVDVTVANFGDFGVSASITGADVTDVRSANDVAELLLAPANAQPLPPANPLRSADIEGIILSSLTQIDGRISEATDGRNAYAMTLSIGQGGLGGGSSPDAEPFRGFVVINEELVPVNAPAEGEVLDPSAPTEELRPSMLILTANSEGVYLNKLFLVSEEELASSN
ncbi:MAG: putative repeat protein (TIGR01451 family) [Candidatus Azotimanducaceae bacterium]